MSDKEPIEEHRDPYDYITNSWKQIMDYIEAAIIIDLENGMPQSAIKKALLLEQVVYGYVGDKHSFEGLLS